MKKEFKNIPNSNQMPSIDSHKWSRKLYIKTNLPDNHVDESFLKLKKINGLIFFLLKSNFDLSKFLILCFF